MSANQTSVNMLDVHFNLDGSYGPYLKQGNRPKYISVFLNHPPAVIAAVFNGVQTRLSDISSSEIMFNREKAPYQEALIKAGHKGILVYTPRQIVQQTKPKRKPRHRHVIWFNPPWNSECENNMGQVFTKALEVHFPIGHKLHTVFTKHTVKLSYSTMPNMAAKVKAHNNKVERDAQEQITPPKICSCTGNNVVCDIWKGECAKPGLVYKGLVVDPTTKAPIAGYIGLTQGTPKARVRNHYQSFRIDRPSRRNETTLSGKIWELREADIPWEIQWEKLADAHPRKPNKKTCNLCCKEALLIMELKDDLSVNKLTELGGICYHRKKHLLSTILAKH